MKEKLNGGVTFPGAMAMERGTLPSIIPNNEWRKYRATKGNIRPKIIAPNWRLELVPTTEIYVWWVSWTQSPAIVGSNIGVGTVC